MTRVAADLHIHSCLSPCGDDEMTPNNIVNMAKLKGLDVIAVCDHNHTGNLGAVSKVAKKHGILLLPGLELETSEEVHLLCYFPSVDMANRMQEIILQHYQNIKNRPEIFGKQWIMDEWDQPVTKIEQMLLTSVKLDLYQAVSFVDSLGGVAVPAHVDRESYSILSNLGAIPEDLHLRTLELSREITPEFFLRKYPEYENILFLSSSDAHTLGMMYERQFFINLDEVSIACLIEKIKGDR